MIEHLNSYRRAIVAQRHQRKSLTEHLIVAALRPLVFVAFLGLTIAVYDADTDTPAAHTSVNREAVDPELLTDHERARWLTNDCVLPADWTSQQAPADMLMRDARTHRITRDNFDQAFAKALHGTAWTLAMCAQTH
jgi:hypothetical protein